MAERTVLVEEVKAFRTSSGNTRYVLRADDGSEYTTFKEGIARQAVAAEGRRARIEYHEQQRNGFTNVYLDKVETLEEEPEGGAVAARRAACRRRRRRGGIREAAAVQGARRR